MNRLVEELDNAIAKEKKLTNDYETADRKCNRAKSLIEKLKDEEVNWAKELEITRKNKINVVGDIMLSAGVIAYMGVFTMDFRAEAIEQWKALCNNLRSRQLRLIDWKTLLVSESKSKDGSLKVFHKKHSLSRTLSSWTTPLVGL
jgi:hypothetical protein